MPEPLNAPTAIAADRVAPIAVAPLQGRGRRLLSPVPAGYVWPSECDRCIPSRRIVEDAFFRTISEASHERGCINHPSKHIPTS